MRGIDLVFDGLGGLVRWKWDEWNNIKELGVKFMRYRLSECLDIEFR